MSQVFPRGPCCFRIVCVYNPTKTYCLFGSLLLYLFINTPGGSSRPHFSQSHSSRLSTLRLLCFLSLCASCFAVPLHFIYALFALKGSLGTVLHSAGILENCGVTKSDEMLRVIRNTRWVYFIICVSTFLCKTLTVFIICNTF